MEMDGFAWLDSAGPNEPPGTNQSSPSPGPSPPSDPHPPEKKPSRIPAIIATIFLSLVVIVSIAVVVPLNHSPPTYYLIYNTPEPEISLLSGKMEFTGSMNGYSIENGLSYFYDIDQILITDAMNTFTYTDSTLIIHGGYVIWWIDTTLDVTITSGSLMIGSSWEGESRTEIALFTDYELELQGHTSLLTAQNCTVTINNQTYNGDLIFQLKGEFTSVHRGPTMKVGVSTSPLDITVEPSSSPLLFETLLDRVAKEETQHELTVPHLPVDANGIALITGPTTTVNGNMLNYSYFCYSRGRFTASVGEGIIIEGFSHFILTDQETFHDEKTYDYLPFIPQKLVGFWPMAIGIWAITRFFSSKRKKSGRQWKSADSASLKYWAAAFHILILIGSLYLWDQEIHDLFGRSLLSTIFSSGDQLFTFSLNNPLILMFPFEFIPWIVGILLIGLPLSLSINAILRVWSLSPQGKGIGKGIGDAATWLIGQAYIIFFLHIALSPLLQVLTNHLFGSS